jgi:hypothetical protein
MGQSNFEFVVDKEKCKRWGIQMADVDKVINTALHGNPITQMVEGEKMFDTTVRWAFVRRQAVGPACRAGPWQRRARIPYCKRDLPFSAPNSMYPPAAPDDRKSYKGPASDSASRTAW